MRSHFFLTHPVVPTFQVRPNWVRYTVAGVFSKCQIPPDNEPDPSTPGNCCLDPVVYQRVDDEIKHWIWNTAPGVRDSMGCPKKIIRMI